MHRASPLSGLLCLSGILALLLCTAAAGAALSDHPVVTGISGPGYISFDELGAPTGSYTFTAKVSCGSPPYTYKWMNPPGMKTLYEGTEYSSVTIPVSQLALSGGDRWAVWLTVTDSAGRDAVWMRTNGNGNSNEFMYGLTTDYTRKSWTKTTEPATFSAAPSGCPSGGPVGNTGGSSGTGSTSGGDGSGGEDGGLPLLPIAAIAAVLAAAGLVGAKVLGGKGAGGAGPTGDAPGTTRTWTDHRGMEHTATLQPDGTWTSDAGTTVDMEKTADARRENEDDLRHSAAQREGQTADEKGAMDAFDKKLDALRKERSKEFTDFQKALRDHAEAERDRNLTMSGVYATQGNIMNGYVAAGAALDKAGDVSVNILVKVAPQVGVPLKQLNTAAKDLGKNISSSYQKGESLWKGAARGALEWGADTIFDGLKDKAKVATGGKLPGLWDFKDKTMSDGLKNAAQTEGTKIIKDALKDPAKKLSNSTLGGTIGKY